MRLLAIGIVFFCGALMACVGVIMDGLPYTHSLSNLANVGYFVLLIAGVLFLAEWWFLQPAEGNDQIRQSATRLVQSMGGKHLE